MRASLVFGFRRTEGAAANLPWLSPKASLAGSGHLDP
jgi:hypothetical protein